MEVWKLVGNFERTRVFVHLGMREVGCTRRMADTAHADQKHNHIMCAGVVWDEVIQSFTHPAACPTNEQICESG